LRASSRFPTWSPGRSADACGGAGSMPTAYAPSRTGPRTAVAWERRLDALGVHPTRLATRVTGSRWRASPAGLLADGILGEEARARP
jgi:hypothetical protein